MKLIFLDIDGTLTVPGENVPPQSALDAIRAARDNGHKVFLCTGRSWAMTESVAACGFDGVICSAGGYVVLGGETVYDHPMDAGELRRVLDAMRAPDIFCILETKSTTFADVGAESFDSTNSEALRWQKMLTESFDVSPLRDYRGEPVYKVSFLCTRRAALERPRQILQDRFEFCLQDFLSGDTVNGELINRDFSKGAAIRRVCTYCGAPVAETVAFGDSMNDLDMIETAGVGVCMGNGSPELKRRADRIAPPVERGGLAAAFRELGLVCHSRRDKREY